MKTTTDNHIDKLLHEAMKQRAAKVPPLADDFAEKVLSKASSLTPRPLQGESELKRRVSPLFWRGIAGGLIAASIVLLIAFHFNYKVLPDQPVASEVTEQQPLPKAPKASDPSEYPENAEPSVSSEPLEPVKPKRTYKARKAIEEPQLAAAETMPKEPAISAQTEEPVAEYLSVYTIQVAPDQVEFIVRTADRPTIAGMPSIGELRARGEQLSANVHRLINEVNKQF